MSLHLHLLAPECIVTLGALGVVAADLLSSEPRRAARAPALAVLTLVCALGLLLLDPRRGTALAGHWQADAFAAFARPLACAGGILLVLLASGHTRRMDRAHGEFYALLLFGVLGVMLVSGVADLMSLFVSLEVVTVSSYVLAAFERNDARSTEAGMKYLVVGAVSSAVLLFGIALVYGACGSVDFAAVSAHAATGTRSTLLVLGTALVLLGLFFKTAAVPFQVWAPDVYQGAPIPVTAFLSSLSKTAGFVLLLRVAQVVVVPAVGAGSGTAWAWFFAGIAALTLLYGNLGAIPQKNVKRLLAYSSIGHAGYLLMGVAAIAAAAAQGRPETARGAAAAILVYLVAYYVTTLTAFAVIVCVSASTRSDEAPEAYAGLGRRSPFLAFAMLLALLSLAGVPPLAGLVGKFLVFYAVVDSSLYWLALLGAVNVVVSLYFYLLLIKQMYVRRGTDEETPIPVAIGPRLAIVAGIVAMLGLGIYWGPLQEAASEAVRHLFAAAG